VHHLKRDIIDGYIERRLDAKSLAHLDRHVTGCLACTLSLSEHGAAAGQWERRGWLGRLVRVEGPQRIPARVADPRLETARAA
jgi:hypothetical protein